MGLANTGGGGSHSDFTKGGRKGNLTASELLNTLG